MGRWGGWGGGGAHLFTPHTHAPTGRVRKTFAVYRSNNKVSIKEPSDMTFRREGWGREYGKAIEAEFQVLYE